jgi:nicotinamide phosphoribosyltransferase
LIQGDGIDFQTLEPILKVLVENKWSIDNIAFGSGGGLLQKLNRDTLKFAFKCADATVDGVHRDVFKQPITDNGKRSKSGRFKLIESDGSFRTVKESDAGLDRLVKVFENGLITKSYTFDEIRERAAS